MSPTPDPPRPPREQIFTPSGIRIVGPGARELAARLSEPRGIAPGREQDVLFAARLLVRPRLGTGSATNAVLGVLHSALAAHLKDAPPLLRDRPLGIPPGRFAGVSWDVAGAAGQWTGELLWRHPHPVVAGAPCTTHLVLVEQAARLDLHVRVTADQGVASVHGSSGAGQARPGFLSDINRTLRVSFDGHEAAPRILAEAQIEGFVREVLLSGERLYPAAVLAPLEQGGHALAPDALADALLGLAPLWVIESHPATFRLSDALGDRRLSAYWGALRVYLPGFTCADRPEEHPLLVHDRLIDPIMLAGVLGELGRAAASRLPMPAGLAARRAAPLPPVSPPAPVSAEPATATQPPAPRPESNGIGERLSTLTEAIANLAGLTAQLLDEMTRLRTTTAVRATSTVSLERRIAELEELLLERFAPPAVAEAHAGPPAGPMETAEEAEAASLVEVLRQAAEAHPDALLILEPAERVAERSPYQDPERLAVILDAMAQVARRRQEGGLGTSLREAFRELGIDYRGGISATTSERHRQQYRVTGPGGKTYECEEHIVLGTSYDPRHCLRIYFTSRAPLEARFVIGHVGRHFEVATTT